jgi:hypothetical protein
MKRRESEFATKFARWAKYNWPVKEKPAHFEYKVSLTGALPFSALSEKQYTNLQLKKIYHKYSDFARIGTMFDASYYYGDGYVVIQYWKPRNKEFFIIPILTFINERDTSKRKSLTEERARELSGSYFLG